MAVHTISIVGYNDSIMYDINNDSLYTNDIDTNGDTIIDFKDWEIGALKLANSQGYESFDSGYIYMMYRLLAMDDSVGGILVSNQVSGISVDSVFEPFSTYKIKLSYPRRKNIQILLSISDSPDELIPIKQEISIVDFKGDVHPMCGKNLSDTIEMGFDLTNLLNEIENPCKFFVDVIEKNDYGNQYDGFIHSFSLYDYRCGEEIEIPLDTADVLLNNDDTTRLVIYYNPIPLTIDFDTLVEIDAAVRCTTEVSDNSTLTFDDDIVVDFYKGTLIVEEGSTLVIGDNVTINSKTGNNKIIVYGEIEIGENLTINASDSSTFQIYIDNDLLDIAISGADFDKTTISGHSKTLTIDDSEFYKGGITYSKADIEINNSDFTHAYFKAGNGAGTSSYCYVTNTSFTFYNGNPVYINSYPQFKIDSCTIF